VAVQNPFEAIQILSSGKWLVLGSEEENYNENDNDDDDERETMRMNAVGNFLEIASTASGVGSWGSSTEANGLVLPTGGDSISSGDRSNDQQGDVGGVAVKCSTKSAIMKLASALQLLNPGVTTTDSGIIIQSAHDAAATIGTAVLLPFDVNLWQAALLVFGSEGIFATES